MGGVLNTEILKWGGRIVASKQIMFYLLHYVFSLSGDGGGLIFWEWSSPSLYKSKSLLQSFPNFCSITLAHDHLNNSHSVVTLKENHIKT